MQPAENKDYSRDVILRLSPTRNTIIVEEQKPGGIAAYREIDPPARHKRWSEYDGSQRPFPAQH